MAKPPTQDPITLIRPNQTWFHLDLRGLLDYRDLLTVMVKRDFTARYRQTILGPIWFLINPLITTLVFTLVFSRVIGVPTDGLPPMLFYLCGNLGWAYFSNVLSGTSNALAGNAALFSKVYFPRLIPPLVVTLSNLMSLGIQFATFLALYARHVINGGMPTLQAPSYAWLLFPFVVLHMALLGLGVGLILSSLTAKYKDLKHIQGFLLQLWMYATPIIYPMSKIPETWRWLANLNPMTAIVEATRNIFLGAGIVEPVGYATSVGVSIFIFGCGVVFYQRTARTFIDTV